MLPVARDGHGRRRPEHALDVPRLDVHHLAVGQQYARDHLVASRVHAQQQAQRLAAPAAGEHVPAGLGLGHCARGPTAAAAQGRARGLHLRAHGPVAADAGEVAAGRGEAARVLHRRLEPRHLRLEAADAAEVLVLAEGGLDRSPYRRHVVAAAEEQRHRAIAQLELAHHGLGGAVHHAPDVLDAVAYVERDHALALGVDAPAARTTRHLGQLVVGEAAEAAVRALGQRLQHHAAGGHVDAQRHRLGREHHLAEPTLEEVLDEALDARQDPRVVQAHPHPEPLEDGLVEGGLRDGGGVPDGFANRLLDLRLLLPRQQGLAFGEHRLHGALAAGAAEDEVDRGKPATRLQRVQHHGGIDHAARVPAALVRIAAVVLGTRQAERSPPAPPRSRAARRRDRPRGRTEAPAGADA